MAYVTLGVGPGLKARRRLLRCSMTSDLHHKLVQVPISCYIKELPTMRMMHPYTPLNHLSKNINNADNSKSRSKSAL